MSLEDNIATLREKVTAAARRADRNPDEITLMAVTKTFSAASIREAYDAGMRVFGENRVQEFAGKVDAVRDLPDAEWHLIGHLQTNKAAKAAELFTAVDSIDSRRLAEKLNAASEKAGKKLTVLIEINVGGEESKNGVAPESPELEEVLMAAPQWDSLQLRGLMTIPPFTDDPEGARHYFRGLRDLSHAIARRHLPTVSMDVLSMGMSHDFEIAIEEGATLLRVGTAIFGQRSKP